MIGVCEVVVLIMRVAFGIYILGSILSDVFGFSRAYEPLIWGSLVAFMYTVCRREKGGTLAGEKRSWLFCSWSLVFQASIFVSITLLLIGLFGSLGSANFYQYSSSTRDVNNGKVKWSSSSGYGNASGYFVGGPGGVLKCLSFCLPFFMGADYFCIMPLTVAQPTRKVIIAQHSVTTRDFKF
jgi:hypothetical protein